MTKNPPAVIWCGALASARYPDFHAYIAERGLAVLAIDQPSSASPLIGEVHDEERLLVDPGDTHRILAMVAHWARHYDVRGVLNTVESFVVPAAMAAELLDLPCPGLRAAVICRDKYLQRQYLAAWSPPFAMVAPDLPALDFDAFPAVFKPTGRHGGSGIVRVVSRAELEAHLAREPLAREEGYLLESFIEGLDISVESLVQDGAVVFESISDERETPAAYDFLEMGYTMPTVRTPAAVADAIYATNRRIIERLGIVTSMVHAEYRVTRSNQVFLIEVGARVPGDGMMEMYKRSTGQSLEAEVIKLALGERAAYPRPRRLVRKVFFEHTPGTLVDVRVDGFGNQPVYLPEGGARPRVEPMNAESGPVLGEILIEFARGDVLQPLREARDRCGSFVLEAESVEQLPALEALEREVLEKLRVVTR